MNPNTGNGIIVLTAGNKLLASDIAIQWTFGKSITLQAGCELLGVEGRNGQLRASHGTNISVKPLVCGYTL